MESEQQQQEEIKVEEGVPPADNVNYDHFVKVLKAYTGKELSELSFEELSRDVNKVCKKLFGEKISSNVLKLKQANYKRRIKADWKQANEAAPGAIASKVVEAVAEAPVEEVPSQEEPVVAEEEQQRVPEIADEEIIPIECCVEISGLRVENAILREKLSSAAGFIEGIILGQSFILAGVLLAFLFRQFF